MVGAAAAEIVLVGVRVMPLVSVGRAEQRERDIAGADALAADLGILGRLPGLELDRADPAQPLFECLLCQRRIASDQLELILVTEQRVGSGSKPAQRGLHTPG